jgi:hypothetical protein
MNDKPALFAFISQKNQKPLQVMQRLLNITNTNSQEIS